MLCAQTKGITNEMTDILHWSRDAPEWSTAVVLNLWYVYHWWYLSPPLVVLRGVSPSILTLWW